jgi:hypothetical protein
MSDQNLVLLAVAIGCGVLLAIAFYAEWREASETERRHRKVKVARFNKDRR